MVIASNANGGSISSYDDCSGSTIQEKIAYCRKEAAEKEKIAAAKLVQLKAKEALKKKEFEAKMATFRSNLRAKMDKMHNGLSHLGSDINSEVEAKLRAAGI